MKETTHNYYGRDFRAIIVENHEIDEILVDGDMGMDELETTCLAMIREQFDWWPKTDDVYDAKLVDSGMLFFSRENPSDEVDNDTISDDADEVYVDSLVGELESIENVVSVNRWTKGEHDRLYLNIKSQNRFDNDSTIYVDLNKKTVVANLKKGKSGAKSYGWALAVESEASAIMDRLG